MPGLGGVGFIDKRAPSHGFNSPTPYVQLYCQEKVVTYAPFGSKPRGAQNLNAIPARSLPMRYLLDCSGEDDSKFEGWIGSEIRILQDAASKWNRSFPARAEVRVSLGNLLETTCNMIVAIGRATKSDAFRHYDKEDWFRWKALRAEHIARLPGTIFGRPSSKPSEWTIVHCLLAAQTFVHGLHCRLFDITVERDIVNMHSLYLRVESDNVGTVYREPRSILTLAERAQSTLYRPFFPAGFRTLQEYFSGISGLDYMGHETRMRPLSSAEEKFVSKVKRATACPAGADMTKLKTMIKYPSLVTNPRGPAARQTRVNLNPDVPVVYIQQDAGYQRLDERVNAILAAFDNGDLLLRERETQELEDYLEEHEILDIPGIVLRFGRSLGLLSHLDEATRLEHLRELQQQEGRQLAIDTSGIVHIQLEAPRPAPAAASTLITAAAERLNAGGLNVYDFQRNLPATMPRTTQAVRALEVQWDVGCSGDGPEMYALSMPCMLQNTTLPPARTNDDREDDGAYLDWLGKAESPSCPFALRSYTAPTVAEYIVFIFSCFQQQLLRSLPPTVRPHAGHADLQGQPYVKALEQADLCVSQQVMRDSYVGLPFRLTRFTATQYTADKWKRFPAVFFPTTLQDCMLHPGWRERTVTYLNMWRGLLERVGQMTNATEVQSSLVTASSEFIQSFKMLPDLTGKVYKPLFDKILSRHAVPIWDDAEFSKGTTTSIENFVPRWMTISPGDRKSPRIRLAYTFMGDSQKQYLGAWQHDVPIRQSKPNYAVLYPSPAPFEYPWMKENYQRIISERGYMIWKEGVSPERFSPENKTRGIGHDWWSSENETVSCSVCRTWSMLNPPMLEMNSDRGQPMDPNCHEMGGLGWGYFACM